MVVGAEQVRAAARKGKLAMAVVAPDASRNSLDKVVPLLEARRVRIIRGPAAASLGAAVGRESTAAVGILDRKLADGIRGSPVTALMNQDDTQLSKKVGSALDVVVGIRNLFGVRRLGVDLRAGLFFPGQAHRIEERSIDPVTGDEKISFRKANKGIGFIAKFWY